MLRFLIAAFILTVVLAWDPHLKIAEKLAVPHHIRHGYDYPYINIAQMMNRRGLRPAVAQQPSSFGIAPQPNVGFRQPAPALAPPSRGFQSQPFDQSRGFSNAPQTRFFNLGVPRSSPFVFERRRS